MLCQAITDKLCEIDPDRADTYRSNMEAYKIELTVLNGPEIMEAIRRYFKPESNADLIRSMSDEQLERLKSQLHQVLKEKTE